MTHYKEVDYRSTAIRTVCTTMTNAISELGVFAKEGVLDGITAKEYASYMEGSALVACQAYAVGCVSDVNDIRGSKGHDPLNKLTLYKEARCSPDKHGYIELINSLANYFKHHEEWEIWPNNETAKTLRFFGIDENTDFPLSVGINYILGGATDLRGLCEHLENWRFKIVQKYR